MNTQRLLLPGVDLEDARERLVDDLPFLLSLLREFVRHAIAVERTFVLDGAPSTTSDDMRKLHQLRGGAGNLAVQSVAGVTARLEFALKTNSARELPDPNIGKSLLDLRAKLQTDLYALRDALRTAAVGIVEKAPLPSGPDSIVVEKPPAPPASRVLIIEDSAAMRSYLKATLEKHNEPLEIIEASNGLKGFQKLTEEHPDLVLCDLQMPDFDGLKLLSMRAGYPDLLEIPVLMLTAEHEDEKKVELLEQGASDYITKPFRSRELLARVKIHLGIRRLRKEVRHVRGLLENSTTIDDLTGVHNRRHFENLLLDEVQRTTRYGVPLALIVLQLDKLDDFAKRAGSAAQDVLLSDTGHFLRDAVRSTDKVARIAHDKFAVVLTHTGRRGASEMAIRLCRSLPDPSSRRDAPAHVTTASFGLVCSEGTPITAKDMIERAHAALDEATKGGGNRMITWTPPVPPRSAEHRT